MNMITHRRYYQCCLILFMIINFAFCVNVTSKKDSVISSSPNSKTVKPVSLTTLKKEETTVAVNETIASNTLKQPEVEDKNVEKEEPPVDKSPEKEDNVAQIVVPQKQHSQTPAALPPPVNPPKAKAEEPELEEPASNPGHPGRTAVLFILFLFMCYVLIHNKKKIMGLIVEGRGGRVNGRRGGANVRYRRLDTDDGVVEAGIQ